MTTTGSRNATFECQIQYSVSGVQYQETYSYNADFIDGKKKTIKYEKVDLL